MSAHEEQTVVALVYDRPGVLNRIVSMIRRRGYNITSLAVGHSETPALSRMCLVVEGDAQTIEQICKQLRKLVDVVHVNDLSNENIVQRELALIRVNSTSSTRNEIIQIANVFRAKIVDIGQQSIIIEITGNEDKVESFFLLMKSYGVLEIIRSGRLAMLRDTESQKIIRRKKSEQKRKTEEGAEKEGLTNPSFSAPS
jgi:acetolactate synthase-1/3 small subunit